MTIVCASEANEKLNQLHKTMQNCTQCGKDLPDQFVLVASSTSVERSDAQQVLMTSSDSAFDDTRFTEQLERFDRQAEVVAHFVHKADSIATSSSSSLLSTLTSSAPVSKSDVDAARSLVAAAFASSDSGATTPLSGAHSTRYRAPRKERLCNKCRHEIEAHLDAEIASEEERARAFRACLARASETAQRRREHADASIVGARRRLAELTGELLEQNAATIALLDRVDADAASVRTALRSLGARFRRTNATQRRLAGDLFAAQLSVR